MTATLITIAAGTLSSQRASWTFDDMPPGRVPQGFMVTDGQPAQAAAWIVQREGSDTFLSHTAQTRNGIDLAVASGTSLGNVSLTARIRFPETAHAAGIAWRYRDPGNYYSVALDLRAQNVRIYRVFAGNRTRLEDEDDLELDPSAWHTLKVQDDSNRMRVWLDGVPVVDTRDRSLHEPGAVGVWTTGDATVWFDNLQVEPLAESSRGNRRD
ncbi:MAG: DUF1080 domain-containing protein [Acidobacteria bacterium]|nr:DUF1080 domain-containing protein [Acidobacteriota bacterium]